MNIAAFRKDLEELVNQHSIENGSHTPDFMLAEYLVGCLEAYNKAVCHRDRWFGLTPWAGKNVVEDEAAPSGRPAGEP